MNILRPIDFFIPFFFYSLWQLIGASLGLGTVLDGTYCLDHRKCYAFILYSVTRSYMTSSPSVSLFIFHSFALFLSLLSFATFASIYIYLSIYLSMYLSIYLSINLPIHPFIYLLICLYLSIYLLIYLHFISPIFLFLSHLYSFHPSLFPLNF